MSRLLANDSFIGDPGYSHGMRARDLMKFFLTYSCESDDAAIEQSGAVF
jgi:hypothetical protein